MTFGKHLRLIIPGAFAALAVAAAPVQAKQSTDSTSTPTVCNLATSTSLGGPNVADDAPTGSPAARYTSDLRPMRGQGGGLVNAAANSPALSLCSVPSGGGGGGSGDPIAAS